MKRMNAVEGYFAHETYAERDENVCMDCGRVTDNLIPWNVGYGVYRARPMCESCEAGRDEESV